MNFLTWYYGLTMEEVFLLTGFCVLIVPALIGVIVGAIVIKREKRKGGAGNGND